MPILYGMSTAWKEAARPRGKWPFSVNCWPTTDFSHGTGVHHGLINSSTCLVYLKLSPIRQGRSRGRTAKLGTRGGATVLTSLTPALSFYHGRTVLGDGKAGLLSPAAGDFSAGFCPRGATALNLFWAALGERESETAREEGDRRGPVLEIGGGLDGLLRLPSKGRGETVRGEGERGLRVASRDRVRLRETRCAFGERQRN
ncbi:hypothetical protein MPTK1_2g11850 [Marchantia polymorpha subsp. ruderalis]|uniref:Uncharacterized protein n=1 Tax=Marchantia polymorpha TaxID=3197 RepID=A0A2R6XCM2_MARPO|nr:hypothetical protein MARPO_0023s0150 [Marchantia polymorpha]BBN01993.1 hypothetical protein Mp_2g11850 [Marchantia polymorpha subsp. ruderalis]|eukprot:PTQ43855.1 hypothetical protein MARPO_0023s0150 [Marchantia polymorpha]